ncbi:MAG: ABC transporter ATP-binding protein [Betaproteobacteria bacterium]|nr:ABC transporter ATP-binding protein [Betaproteobacteria bacterium]
MSTILEARGIHKNFGGFAALSNVGLRVDAGERLGLIGPNGSGKTTLINCIAGAMPCDAGSVRFEDSEIGALAAHQRARLGLARTFQLPRPFSSMTVLENVCVPLEYTGARGAGQAPSALEILREVGLAEQAHALANSLTQVDLRRLELARALAVGPKLLILDEVMAGLSTSEVDAVLKLVLRLNEQGIAVLMIEHIMHAIMKFSQRVVCLDAGQIVAEGVPSAIVADPIVRRIYLGA